MQKRDSLCRPTSSNSTNLPNCRTVTAAAENILKLETALAKAQWSRTELRDAEKRYNLYEVAKLTDVSAKLPWACLL